MMEAVPNWSSARVDHLRRLWEEGRTASQIAAELGGVTRNAVIGKIHRLGLSNRTKTGEASGGTPRGTREGDGASVVENAIARAEMPIGGLSSASASRVGLSLSRRVTIMDLRESMCRWPIGDPTAPDFHYCGDRSITGLPYCTTHAQIAYQPAVERKRRVGGFR